MLMFLRAATDIPKLDFLRSNVLLGWRNLVSMHSGCLIFLRKFC